MTDTAVVDASPLIFLSRGGHLGLLREFYARVIVPVPVMAEISARDSDDPTRKAADAASWIELGHPPMITADIAAWGLGPGESAVLAIAAAMANAEAILDDQAARRCARAQAIPMRGTLGLVLLAKKHGALPAARPVLEDLIRGGMYLSSATLNTALQRVGE